MYYFQQEVFIFDGLSRTIPAGIYLLKVNNRNWRRSGIFTVTFEHISHLVLVFLWLTLSR